MKNLLMENDKLNEKKEEITKDINDTIEKIYNLKTLRKKYLGIDYKGNEYYYFITGEGVIYTKNRKKEEWAFFDNKDDIEILINKLTEKGKNEKKLKNVLKFFLAQMKEKEEKEKLEQEKQKELEDNQSSSEEEDIQQNMEEEEQNMNNVEIPKVKIDLGKKPDSDKKNNSNSKSDKKLQLRSGNKKKLQFSEDDIHILESDSDIEINDASEEINNSNDINTNSKEPTEKNNNNNSINPLPKKELITFTLSEEHLPLNIILIQMEQIFTDYLVQFNKQWESEDNRKKWREIITNNATDKNILISLKMFNLRFKNPYKILSKDDEVIIKDKGMKYYMNFFDFEEENGNEFKIPETNLNLILSPKVKIWSKEMDLIDIDFYYSNDLLLSVFSREQLCYIVHFYEMAIFGLVHRREGKRKL